MRNSIARKQKPNNGFSKSYPIPISKKWKLTSKRFRNDISPTAGRPALPAISSCSVNSSFNSRNPVSKVRTHHRLGITARRRLYFARGGELEPAWLLATIAGALASRKLNILSADIFMREDDLVLDIFRVCTTNFRAIKQEREIKKIEGLICDACSAGKDAHPVDFKSLIARESKPSVLDQPKPEISMPQRVLVSNEQSQTTTVLEIQAEDRIGLLHDIFTALTNLDVEVLNARISTQAGAAIDRFYLIDTNSEKKITDPVKLNAIQKQVWKCVTVAEEDGRKPET